MDVVREFISKEERVFDMALGKVLASALAGFVAGALAATIIFVTLFYASGKWGM